MDIGFGFIDDSFIEHGQKSTEKVATEESKQNEVIEDHFPESIEKSVPRELCVPLTIKFLLHKMKNKSELKIHNFDISGIIIFGRVSNIKPLASATIFEICDYTGFIEAKYNKDAKNEKVKNHIEEIQIGDHIKVVGGVYSPENETVQISVTYLNKIKEWASYSIYFTWEVIYCYLKLLKLKKLNANDEASSHVFDADDDVWRNTELDSETVANFDKIDIDILKYVKTYDDGKLTIGQLIQKMVKYYSENEVEQSIAKLKENFELVVADDFVAIP